MIRKAMMAVVASMMLVGGVHSALALTWVDVDSGYPLKFLRPSDPSYSSTFNILADGFNPATMEVTSATASFAFADDQTDVQEFVDIYLDGSLFIDDQEVDGSHIAYDWHSGALTGTLIGSLNTDGILNYTVTVTSGDTYLKVAKLEAQGRYKVPDGGLTVLLLGASLSGLAVLSRKFGRQS